MTSRTSPSSSCAASIASTREHLAPRRPRSCSGDDARPSGWLKRRSSSASSSSRKARRAQPRRRPSAQLLGRLAAARLVGRAHGERRPCASRVDGERRRSGIGAVRRGLERRTRARQPAPASSRGDHRVERGAFTAACRTGSCGATSSTSPQSTRALAAHALGQGAEHVGEVAPDLALVDQAGEPARPGQHAEERRLGEADRADAVVDEDDLVAGERQLVPAARGRAVERGEVVLPALGAHLLEVEARLVGELAEVDLEARGVLAAQHVDVGAGAEDAVLARW